MSGAHIDCSQKFHGLKAIILENEHLQLTILPELGSKIYHLIHKAAGRDILWQNHKIKPHIVPFGSSFDDIWCGGWDEQFPNDEPVEHKGVSYPDHGELWCVPWDWKIEEESPKKIILHMHCTGSVTRTVTEKWISLAAGEPYIRLKYRITNDGDTPIDYIWKLHPAFAVSPQHRIDLPPCKVIIDKDYRERFGGQSEYIWPYITSEGIEEDMRRILPAAAGTLDFQYAMGYDDGWFAVTDTERCFGFGMVFPKQVFNTIWLFLVYGGWRGLYTAVIEPSTGYPSRLDVASRLGTCPILKPGHSVEAEILGVAYSGVASVSRISTDGSVRK